MIIGETDYGVTFASVLAKDNIVATQFHPEKSGENGLRMYANFLAAAAAAAGQRTNGKGQNGMRD